MRGAASRSVMSCSMMKGVAESKRWWNGEITALEFLSGQDPAPVLAILTAAAAIVETRKVQLDQLLAHFEKQVSARSS